MAGTKKKATTRKIILNEKLYQDISRYCQMNNIEDVDTFINKCLMQGYNVVKFGYSPKDNLRREVLGIKEPEDIPNESETQVENEEKKTTKRPIRIIKKD